MHALKGWHTDLIPALLCSTARKSKPHRYSDMTLPFSPDIAVRLSELGTIWEQLPPNLVENELSARM
jgi:hypothetical protein